jgi:hypothetical protein
MAPAQITRTMFMIDPMGAPASARKIFTRNNVGKLAIV